jgi:C4-dicarboxylate transporter, DctQ subunit
MFYNATFVVKRISASGQTSPAMGLPMVVIYASLVVGFALAILRGVQKIVVLLRKNVEIDAINTGRM